MKQKFGYISIIGLANAGKSTLTNYLSKNNLSIVSRKAQTTKTQVTAIITEDNYQMVIVDTPGIFKNLDSNIYTDAAMAAIIDSDIVVVMIDSAKSNLEDNFKLLQYLSDKKINYVLALNKIDLIKKDRLLYITSKINDINPPDAVFMISVLKNNGILDLKKYLIDNLPSDVFHFDSKTKTTLSGKFLISEITRKYILENLHEEIPYKISITTDYILKKTDSIMIRQKINIPKKSYKDIIIGKNNIVINKIKNMAQKKMQMFFDNQKIDLDLQVKLLKSK